MTFKDRFETLLLEISLYSKDTMSSMSVLIPTLVSHILKVLITKDDIDQNLDYWNKEIKSYLTKMINARRVKTDSIIRGNMC